MNRKLKFYLDCLVGLLRFIIKFIEYNLIYILLKTNARYVTEILVISVAKYFIIKLTQIETFNSVKLELLSLLHQALVEVEI